MKFYAYVIWYEHQEPAYAGESIINFLTNEDTSRLAARYLHFLYENNEMKFVNITLCAYFLNLAEICIDIAAY
jgi:hypothetical protein